MPPWPFSNFMVQRGTIMEFIVGEVPVAGIAIPAGIVPDIPIAVGFIIVLAMIVNLLVMFLAEQPHTLTASLSREYFAFLIGRVASLKVNGNCNRTSVDSLGRENHCSGSCLIRKGKVDQGERYFALSPGPCRGTNEAATYRHDSEGTSFRLRQGRDWRRNYFLHFFDQCSLRA